MHFIGFLIVCILLSSSNIYASSVPYIKMGLAIPSAIATEQNTDIIDNAVANQVTNFGNIISPNIAIGYNTVDNVRVEASLRYVGAMSYSYHSSNYKINIIAPMFQGYHDIVVNQTSGSSVYFGAGAGVAYTDATLQTTDSFNYTDLSKSLNLAIALMLGISQQITDKAIMDIGYEFDYFAKPEQCGFNVMTNAITASLRYSL